MHSLNFPAIHLHASLGKLVKGVRRVDSRLGDDGNVTYGPYIPLGFGRYRFAIEYSGSAERFADVGAWDVFTSADGGITLGQGQLAVTGTKVDVVRGEFEVPRTLSGEKFEIRTFFHGFGSLEIHSIRIDVPDHPWVAPVDFGALRQLNPKCPYFGRTRGEPIDRFYIAEFLAEHRGDIKGRVLEVGDPQYTLRFGRDRVTVSDILSPTPDNPDATIIADLSHAPGVPADTFDCIILTQVLNVIYDLAGALATIHRILKPGGVVLATLPSITKAHQDYAWPFLWSFTGASARRLFGEVFGARQTEVTLYGNVLSATAFLYGLSFHELEETELRYVDPNFPVTIGVRAVKSS